MQIHYSVTFEFESRGPLSHRGIVQGASAATCARRAIAEAQRALRAVGWSSMVYVALERVSDADADLNVVEASI